MGPRTSRLPNEILEQEVRYIERELNALKEAQIIGRSNTQVKKNQGMTTYDLSFNVPASTFRTATVTFTSNLQKNAFFDLITKVWINGVFNGTYSDRGFYYCDSDSASSQTSKKAKIYLYGGGSGINVDIKCIARSVDSGVINVVVT